jgi:hypothetical protein
MKPQSNTKGVRYFAMLALLLATISGSVNKTHADDSNPYQPGNETVVLTDAERNDFLAYVSQAKILIDQANALAAGKSVSEKRKIYTRASLDAVRAIANANTRTQLLSQMAINQAIALTIGVPTSDGSSIPVPGLLDGNDPRLEPVVETILEDSLRLAAGYLSTEAAGLQQPSFLLPFADFAGWRLAYAQKWLILVKRAGFSPISSYLNLALNQFMSVMLQPAQIERAKYAVQIEEVDAAINPKAYPNSVSYSDDEKATLMSGALDTVSNEMNAAIIAGAKAGGPDLPIFNAILVTEYRPSADRSSYGNPEISATELLGRTLSDDQIETLLGESDTPNNTDFDLIAINLAASMNYAGKHQADILIHSATDYAYDWGTSFGTYFDQYAPAVSAGLNDEQVKGLLDNQVAAFGSADCTKQPAQAARRRGIVLIGESKSAMKGKALGQIKKMENTYKGRGCTQFGDLVKKYEK